MAESYTPNLGLTQIGTGDLVNAWGPVESTNKAIVDNAAAGMISINLPAQTGYPTVVLTFTQGSSTQQLPNRRIVFTARSRRTRRFSSRRGATSISMSRTRRAAPFR
jgi:hypothetical protein